MISFKQFLRENFSRFHRDNPGGEWLKTKQEDAQYGITRHKGLRGAVTGYYDKPLKMKVDDLYHLPGANDEQEYRQGSSKMINLEKQVGNPSNFDSKKFPIMIGVNHHGKAYVMEGNHRLAYANKNNIPYIHAEIKYYNGGENVHKGFHPDDVETMKIKE